MKVTKQQLRQVVKEELESMLEEPSVDQGQIELEIEQQIDKARFAISRVMTIAGEELHVLKRVAAGLAAIEKDLHYARRKIKKAYHYSKRNRQ